MRAAPPPGETVPTPSTLRHWSKVMPRPWQTALRKLRFRPWPSVRFANLSNSERSGCETASRERSIGSFSPTGAVFVGAIFSYSDGKRTLKGLSKQQSDLRTKGSRPPPVVGRTKDHADSRGLEKPETSVPCKFCIRDRRILRACSYGLAPRFRVEATENIGAPRALIKS